MSKLDSALKKDIVKNLHAAIDNELIDNDVDAYRYYIESLRLVAECLKKDVSEHNILTVKDKQNLIEFAKQSVARLSLMMKKEGGNNTEERNSVEPSAPFECDPSICSSTAIHSVMPDALSDLSEQKNLLSRYHRRLNNANTPLEKQNLELELARQLVENAAITRNRFMQATAWAMQNAHRHFNIPEKIKGGTLKESDFRKQQLFAIAFQYNEGNPWLKQYSQDLSLYPNNGRLTRELLDTILSDTQHPVRCTLVKMQEKIHQMISLKEDFSNTALYMEHFITVSNEIKQDLNILYDVLKNLFEPLKNERNSQITNEVLYNFYFGPLKSPLISLLRFGMKETEQCMLRSMNNGCKDECHSELTDDCKKEAITKLHYLLTLHNPYDMTECAVNVIRILTTSEFDKNHFTSLGADDLIPRLCEVVIQSKLVALAAETVFMDTFMPSEKSLSEEGYAVTMLQSVVSHLGSE